MYTNTEAAPDACATADATVVAKKIKMKKGPEIGNERNLKMNKQKTVFITTLLRWSAFSPFAVLLVIQVISGASEYGQDGKESFVNLNPPSGCVWTFATEFPIPIMDEAVVPYGNNIYTFAGISNGLGVPNSYKFDGTTWIPIAPYPWACGVEWPSAVTDSKFVYIMNGSKFCPFVYSTDVFRYDPNTDTYTQLASNSVGTWNQTAVYLNGKIYKMGGKNASGYQTALEIYDIATDMWSLGASLPQPAGFAAFLDAEWFYLYRRWGCRIGRLYE